MKLKEGKTKDENYDHKFIKKSKITTLIIPALIFIDSESRSNNIDIFRSLNEWEVFHELLSPRKIWRIKATSTRENFIALPSFFEGFSHEPSSFFLMNLKKTAGLLD